MTKRELNNFEKYYDYKTENELMAVHRTKGAKMQVQSKQDLREEIKRQQAIIDQLLNTIVEKDKDVAVISKLFIDIIQFDKSSDLLVNFLKSNNLILEQQENGSFKLKGTKPKDKLNGND